MKPAEITLTAGQLGEVLGITARRVRQLAEEGVFQRIGRGRFPLVESVQAYLASLDDRSDSAELRGERVKLIRAQARRIELANEQAESTGADMDAAEAAVKAATTFLLIRLRPLADWTHQEMNGRVEGDLAREIAARVQGWIIGARHEIEVEVLGVLAAARRRGVAVRDYDDFIRLLSRQAQGAVEVEEGAAGDG